MVPLCSVNAVKGVRDTAQMEQQVAWGGIAACFVVLQLESIPETDIEILEIGICLNAKSALITSESRCRSPVGLFLSLISHAGGLAGEVRGYYYPARAWRRYPAMSLTKRCTDASAIR